MKETLKPFGPQEPPQDYRIFRGTVKEFFDSAAKALNEDADREMIGDDIDFDLGPIGNK